MADERPIIIKKIKKGGHDGHHGGAWKVAYADFVTAMMAFFLLLWLLSSVDKSKLDGLAEYFTPTIGIRDSMGIGFQGGMTESEEGKERKNAAKPSIVQGAIPQGPTPSTDVPKEALIESDKDAKLFEKAEESIKRAFESDPNLRDISENVVMEQSPEGLKIEVMDSDKNPMFAPGGVVITDFGKSVLSKMGKVVEQMPNFISITGHTDASSANARTNYTNWELSSDRANAARRYLLSVGMDKDRVKKIVGQADTELLVPEQPLSPRNRRITVILLRGAYLQLRPENLPVTRDLLSVPSPSGENAIKAREEMRKQQIKEEQEKVGKPAPGAPTGPSPDLIIAPLNNDAQKAGSAPVTQGQPPKETPRVDPSMNKSPPSRVPTKPQMIVVPPGANKERTDEDFTPFIAK